MNHGDLNTAVARLEAELPGWWWSMGWCHVSSDCSIGVDSKGPDAHLTYVIGDDRFDSGFHHDYEGGDVAGSMHKAIDEALAAKAALTREDIAAARLRHDIDVDLGNSRWVRGKRVAVGGDQPEDSGPVPG